MEIRSKPLSLKKRRYAIGTNSEKCLEQIINLYFFTEDIVFAVEHIYAFVVGYKMEVSDK